MNKTAITSVVAVALLLGACGDSQQPQKSVAPVKVRTLVVAGTAVAGSQSYSGTIEEASGTSLSFTTPGTLKSITVSEGQTVSAGQLIATVDETQMRSAYEAAQATREQALDAEARLRQLHDAGSLPEIKWIEVQTQVKQAQSSELIARKALADTRLCAPFSGYIAQKQAEVGQNVGPGVPVVRMVRIDQVKVRISVPEEEIATIRIGQPLTVTVQALDGRQFEARVSEKGVSADPLSRSYEVKALISNPQRELLPGMLAEVRWAAASSQPAEQAVALPAEVVLIDADNRPFVWTVADGKARRAYVELGQNVGSQVQLTSGLKPGDRVIAEGQQKVSTGMSVEELKN